MRLYFSDIRGADEALAKYPPLSANRGSAFGISLLAAAYEDFAPGELPPIMRLLGKKPAFEPPSGLHFSISHSRSHVLCAISEHPVGADTLDHRYMRPESIARLATAEELEAFSFHELWALRESYYKLTGEGDLRSLRFRREGLRPRGPREDVFSRLYLDIDESSTAVSSFSDDFPDHVIKVPIERLLKKPGLLTKIQNEEFLQR